VIISTDAGGQGMPEPAAEAGQKPKRRKAGGASVLSDPDANPDAEAPQRVTIGSTARTMRARHCGISYEPPSPQLFSFNSPQGMCVDCQGLGMRHDFDRGC